MKLRNAKGLIICSQETQLHESIEINFQEAKGQLQIVVIKPSTKGPSPKLRGLMLAGEERLFMPEYLTLANLKVVKDAISRFVTQHKSEASKTQGQEVFKAT
jgi:hypothetical protein